MSGPTVTAFPVRIFSRPTTSNAPTPLRDTIDGAVVAGMKSSSGASDVPPGLHACIRIWSS